MTHLGIRVFMSKWAGRKRHTWRPACDRSPLINPGLFTTQDPAQVTCKTCQRRKVFKEVQQGIWPGTEKA